MVYFNYQEQKNNIPGINAEPKHSSVVPHTSSVVDPEIIFLGSRFDYPQDFGSGSSFRSGLCFGSYIEIF
jgi:hypothetical protein